MRMILLFVITVTLVAGCRERTTELVEDDLLESEDDLLLNEILALHDEALDHQRHARDKARELGKSCESEGEFLATDSLYAIFLRAEDEVLRQSNYQKEVQYKVLYYLTESESGDSLLVSSEELLLSHHRALLLLDSAKNLHARVDEASRLYRRNGDTCVGILGSLI